MKTKWRRSLAAMSFLFYTLPVYADVIYSNDFENTSTPLTEWSYKGSTPPGDPVGITPGTAQHPADRFIGQFSGNDSTILTLNNLPAHTSLTSSFDLYLIRTWDGTGYVGAGPDIWDLSIKDGQTLLHTTFSNQELSGNIYQTYPNQYPGSASPARSGAIENNTLGFVYLDVGINRVCDSVYHLSFTFPHSAGTVSLDFSSVGLQNNFINGNVYDESWGLDNVTVTPEPATLLLLGLGGLAIIRKKRSSFGC